MSTPTPTRTALRVIATIATAALVAIAVSGGVIAYELHRQTNIERESACYAELHARSAQVSAVADNDGVSDGDYNKKSERLVEDYLNGWLDECN